MYNNFDVNPHSHVNSKSKQNAFLVIVWELWVNQQMSAGNQLINKNCKYQHENVNQQHLKKNPDKVPTAA